MTPSGYAFMFLTAHVAVLIETETSWGARVIRGIAHYAEKHAHWHLLIDPRDHEQRPAIPEGWRGDAIEAEPIAYLPPRAHPRLPISFPKTTGVPKPMTGGKVVRP